MDDFIFKVKQPVKYKQDVSIIVDGAWSHPGWWAKECTVIALDGETGLPLGFKNVIKHHNYEGSSKGKCQLYLIQLNNGNIRNGRMECSTNCPRIKSFWH